MPTPTQPVVLFGTGIWTVTADGELRLGCCPCPECACCFEGDTPGGHCMHMTHQDCHDAGGEWFGYVPCRTCLEAFMSGECIYGLDPVPCNACPLTEMPRAIVVQGLSPICCVRPDACLPEDGPSCEERVATCRWKAEQFEGTHVVVPHGQSCWYSKTWHAVGPDGWLATFSVSVYFEILTDIWQGHVGWRGHITCDGVGATWRKEFGLEDCHGFVGDCASSYETCVEVTGPEWPGLFEERLVALAGSTASCSF